MWSEQSSTEYFKELVEQAFKHQHVDTNVMVSFYIVNLLVKCIAAEETSHGDEPLAITFTKATQSSMAEQSILFRRIGDLSLYLSGFFADSLSRKLVDVDYYISLGKSSYSHLATLETGAGGQTSFANVYQELAGRFLTFTNILTEVSEQCRLTSNENILRLYERWLKTRSELVARMLREIGIEPLDNITSNHIQ
ncbi:MAG: hypothetical protein GY721_09565 [Deltaproteobacteria bacterium]|nr:hypothetical protein [Deltaproteobacteria bacterium]